MNGCSSTRRVDTVLESRRVAFPNWMLRSEIGEGLLSQIHYPWLSFLLQNLGNVKPSTMPWRRHRSNGKSAQSAPRCDQSAALSRHECGGRRDGASIARTRLCFRFHVRPGEFARARSGVRTEIPIPPAEVSRRSAVTHLGFPMRSLS
jgi:hypothetical protein